MDSDSILALFAHEMVYNWLMLDQIEVQRDSLQWYAEGLADYYSTHLRLRYGLSSSDLPTIANRLVQAYYTNPLVDKTSEELGKLTWKTSNAQRLPYSRGFVFFVRLDALIKKATDNNRSLDDAIVDMVIRARGRAACNFQEFLDRIAEDIGSEAAQEEYLHLASGKLIVPPEQSLAPGLVLQRCDMEMFDLGFDEDSVLQGPRIVRSLKDGSRAAQSGIQNGDQILKWTDLNMVKDCIDKTMDLTIKRGEQELQISFWPRSLQKVEAYKWVKA